MRKILTSVLGVAGLLAVVLALASSPASAAKDVITFESPADATAGNAGTYTITWETQGGCDPGSGTSGASGSVSLTVDETTPGGGTGDQVETGIVIDDICNYDYEVSFVSTAGVVCAVTIPATPTDGTFTIALTADGCATMSAITVTIVGGVDVAQELCTQDDLDNDTENCDDAADTTDTVKVAEVRNAVNDGAVAASTFTVTATPSEDAADACVGDSGDAEVPLEGQPNAVTLNVMDSTPGAATNNCMYDISVSGLPDGFEADSRGSTSEDEVNPLPDSPTVDDDSDATTPDDEDSNPADNQIFTVKVSLRQVFLVQRVHGDAGGGNASYELAGTESCAAPGLPGILEPTAASGGISSVGGETVVELRTGAFNISGAITGNHDSGDPELVTALDAEGNACEASVSIKGVPAHCTVQSNSPINLSTSGERAIIGFDIDCRPPAMPEPDPEPMDDTDDMGGDDMGADDMGADDMGADDMGGDDMGDMGPPVDTPTG
ncbi:MAG: hypothetical protein OXH28_00380 [bacterium]|nr:hypothetical protein [bacterium]